MAINLSVVARQIEPTVRSMATQLSVRYIWFPELQLRMALRGIDVLDVRNALKLSWLLGVETFGNVTRYLMVGEDTEGRHLRMLIVLCQELSAIEIISVDVISEA